VVRPPPGGQARSLELCLDTLGDRRRRPRSHFSPVDMGVATIGHDQNPRARCAQLANASAAGAARGGVAAAFERRVPGDVLITRRSLHSRDLARWFARAQSVRTRYPSPRSDDFGARHDGPCGRDDVYRNPRLDRLEAACGDDEFSHQLPEETSGSGTRRRMPPIEAWQTAGGGRNLGPLGGRG
jgi:hypothetical protein